MTKKVEDLKYMDVVHVYNQEQHAKLKISRPEVSNYSSTHDHYLVGGSGGWGMASNYKGLGYTIYEFSDIKFPAEYVKLKGNNWSINNEYVGEIFELSTLNNLSKFRSAPTKEVFRANISSWIPYHFSEATKEEFLKQEAARSNRPSLENGKYYYAFSKQGNTYEYIFECSGDGRTCSNMYITTKSWWGHNTGDFTTISCNTREATADEIKWYLACKKANAFVTKEEAMKEENLIGRWIKALVDRPAGGGVKKGEYGRLKRRYNHNNDYYVDFTSQKDYVCTPSDSSKYEIMPIGFEPIKSDKIDWLEEVKKRYPLGSQFKCLHGVTNGTITDYNQLEQDSVGVIRWYGSKDNASGGCGCVYASGRWAEIINQKEGLSLETWLENTKALNLTESNLAYFINEGKSTPYYLYNKLEGKDNVEKARILYSKWNTTKPLVEAGKYYTVTDPNVHPDFMMIGRVTVPEYGSDYTGKRGRADYLNVPYCNGLSGQLVRDGAWCYYDSQKRSFRLSTLEEISWLNRCLAEDRIVPRTPKAEVAPLSTKLKIGDEISIAAINAWITSGPNEYIAQWEVAGTTYTWPSASIVKIEVKNGILAFSIAGFANVWIRLEGFEEFAKNYKPKYQKAFREEKSLEPTTPGSNSTPIRVRLPKVHKSKNRIDSLIHPVQSIKTELVRGSSKQKIR